MNKSEIARKLNINIRTLHNWEKNRKELYQFIIQCYENKSNNENISITQKEKELLDSFRKLDKEEQDLYYHEIKARALRKKLK